LSDSGLDAGTLTTVKAQIGNTVCCRKISWPSQK